MVNPLQANGPVHKVMAQERMVVCVRVRINEDGMKYINRETRSIAFMVRGLLWKESCYETKEVLWALVASHLSLPNKGAIEERIATSDPTRCCWGTKLGCHLEELLHILVLRLGVWFVTTLNAEAAEKELAHGGSSYTQLELMCD